MPSAVAAGAEEAEAAEAEAAEAEASSSFSSFSPSASAETTPQGSSTAGTGRSIKMPIDRAATCTGTASGPVPPRTLGR